MVARLGLSSAKSLLTTLSGLWYTSQVKRLTRLTAPTVVRQMAMDPRGVIVPTACGLVASTFCLSDLTNAWRGERGNVVLPQQGLRRS